MSYKYMFNSFKAASVEIYPWSSRLEKLHTCIRLYNNVLFYDTCIRDLQIYRLQMELYKIADYRVLEFRRGVEIYSIGCFRIKVQTWNDLRIFFKKCFHFRLPISSNLAIYQLQKYFFRKPYGRKTPNLYPLPRWHVLTTQGSIPLIQNPVIRRDPINFNPSPL